MGCGGCRTKKKNQCPKKRKRLPSINPFFHFLKCVWKKFRGCRRSVVVRYAVKKWRRMNKTEKQPFFDAACRAQAMHRASKKPKSEAYQQSYQKQKTNKSKCLNKTKKKKKTSNCPKC